MKKTYQQVKEREEKIIRQVKKTRLLNHPFNNPNFSRPNGDKNVTFSNSANMENIPLPSLQVNHCPTVINSVASQSSNFFCSHEKVQIEFRVSSDELSRPSMTTLKHGNNINNGHLAVCLNSTGHSQTNIHLDKDFRESIVTDKLLSMDDSLLQKIDLSFIEDSKGDNTENKNNMKEFTPKRMEKSFETLTPRKTNNSKDAGFNKSPDIFNSNRENSDVIDTEDQAWDMSISVMEEKDRTVVEETNTVKNLPMSPGLSEILLSTWVNSAEVSPKVGLNDGKTTFEDRLKRTLSNNAHLPTKKIVPLNSPQLMSSLPVSNISTGEDLFFGLPSTVRSMIKRFKGIPKLYEWQEECLNLPAIKNRKNLVYALPTSGGKTLVAEILVLKEILCREKNVLFVLPFVSIAQEKVRALSLFAVELGFLVEEYAGSKGSYPPQKRRRKRSVYVATIEKALGLVHSLIECKRIQELGLIVVDELHLIGEPRRGAHLESMLTKIIYIKGDIQIIGMSATIGNLSDITLFLNADVYTQDFRPVELTEYVKVEEELFKVDHSVQDEVPLIFHSKLSFQYSQEQKRQDPDQIGALVQEITPEHSCLVFCPSKKNCENVALLVCNALERNIVEHKYEDKKALFRALMSEGNGSVCPILKKTLPFGVAYHHSGLTTAERSLLEEAFLAKTICCICCTSTLAAGVNLPARRVILRSPYIGMQLLTLSKYKQMVGRAGRTGMGDFGESFLICKPQEAQNVGELLSSAMDLCDSQLCGSGLASLIISALDLALAPTTSDLEALCRCSLLSVQASRLGVDLAAELTASLNQLEQAGALVCNASSLVLTNIGKAAVKANVDVECAKLLYGDLQGALESLVLLSHLHLLYLVTPYTMMDQIHFQQRPFCNAYMELGPKEMQTAKVLGIGEQCIAQLMTGKTIKGNLNQVLHRFYLSLILLDLWNQNSVWKVSNKYSLPRGLIHNFLISASAFSSSVVRFCEVLEDMWCFKLLLSEMSSRLTHCCTLELLPLMELPAVKIGRAKQLYNAGFKTINILAKTEPKALVQAVDHMPRRVAHQIVAAAKLMLLAKVESLQEEAEDVLEGLRDV